MVWFGRAAFPTRGWSCLQCCALKQVTTWPLSSMAVQILLGSFLTAWLTEMVCITDAREQKVGVLPFLSEFKRDLFICLHFFCIILLVNRLISLRVFVDYFIAMHTHN